MDSKSKIYDAFAELIYSVVMADGKITNSEKLAIAQVVKEHPIKNDIQRYFELNNKEISIAQSFLYTLETCKSHGNDEEYPFLISIVEQISKVSEGFDDDSLFLHFASNFKKKFSFY